MSDTIRNAFKALDEIMDVRIDPIKPKRLIEAKEEDEYEGEYFEEPEETLEVEIEEEDKTLRDLFEEAGAYVLTHDFEYEGLNYSLFIEGLLDGEAADIIFEEFDVDNINEVLVEILDEDRDFIDNISQGRPEWDTLEATVSEVVEAAKAFLSGDEEHEDEGESEFDEPLEFEDDAQDKQEKISQHIIPDHSKKEVQLEEISLEEDKTEGRAKFNRLHKLFSKPKRVAEDLNTEIWEGWTAQDFIDELEPQFELIMSGNSMIRPFETREEIKRWCMDNQHEYKEYIPEVVDFFAGRLTDNSEFEDRLTEGTEFNIRESEDLEDAKELLDKEEESVPVEKIVDVNAETISDLKKTYIGDAILQCPVCKTMIYKDLEELVAPEDGDGLYNEEEECPHCGSSDGFKLVGQVASLDVEEEENSEEDSSLSAEEAEPETDEFSDEELEDAPEEAEQEEAPPISAIPEEDEEGGFNESLGKKGKNKALKNRYKTVVLDSLDESKFDRLAKKYLSEVYDNVEHYTTIDGHVDNKNNTLIIEGKIKFKGGKLKDTKFIFEAKELSKKGKLKLIGINETFANTKAFTLKGTVKNSNLLSESLAYGYTIDNKKVYGEVKNPARM